jgi:GT2 family glycosyltransferase
MSASVTIVIPTFNRADWLPGAIDSVLAQDRGDLEVLVVDDGSEDGTGALLERYAATHDGRRFRSLRQANAGQAAAINRGWREARGDFVGYLSDDDRLLSGAVRRLAAELERNPEATIAYPGYRVIDVDGGVLDTIRPIEYTPEAAFRQHDTVIGPGALIRKAAMLSSGGWETEYRWMGDFVLWIKLGSLGRAIRVPEPLALWRRHPEAATTQASPDHAREHLLVFDRAVELLGESASVADRAEGLRNACLLGYFFAGPEARRGGDGPLAIDLQHAAISAFGAGLGIEETPDRRADEAARLWRLLAAKTVELLELRHGPPPGEPLGVAHAQDLLAGLDPNPTGDGASLAELGATMLEAAFHCGADIDPGRSRFLVIEPGRLEPAEEEELVHFAIRCTIENLRRLIESRDLAIAAARGPG